MTNSNPSAEFVAQSAVAKCCCNSAAMLHVADSDGDYSPAQRRTFQKFNRGQAELLVEAAKQADQMLTALKVAKANLQPLGDSPALDIIISAIDRAEGKS